MEIHCTRGCICDCLTVNKKDCNELSESELLDFADKIRDYIIQHGISGSSFDWFLEEVWSLEYEDGISEDPETCEMLLNGVEAEKVPESEAAEFVKKYFDEIHNGRLGDMSYIPWWFMTDYIGLDYQYHCDCCGDSVYSKTINI